MGTLGYEVEVRSAKAVSFVSGSIHNCCTETSMTTVRIELRGPGRSCVYQTNVALPVPVLLP